MHLMSVTDICNEYPLYSKFNVKFWGETVILTLRVNGLDLDGQIWVDT